MNTAKNSFSIANVLSTSRQVAPVDAKPVFTGSTFELDLTHPQFNREDFLMVGNGYAFRMEGKRIMFGATEAFADPASAEVFDIAFNMHDAWKRQESSLTAFKNLVVRPQDYVLGLHKAGKDWFVSKCYDGELTELISDDESAINLLGQLEMLPDTADYYPVSVIPGINGSQPVLRVSKKPMRDLGNGAYRTYTHQAMDHLLAGNIITFSWKADHSLNKKLAIILGSIQAFIDGDEELYAIYEQHYKSAVVRKTANRQAAREIGIAKANDEAPVASDYSELTGMDAQSGEEIVLSSLSDAVLAFLDDRNSVRTTMEFRSDNVYHLKTVEKLIGRGWSVEVLCSTRA